MGALLDSLAPVLDALPLRDAAGLGDARRAALDAALHDGLPGTRSERWALQPDGSSPSGAVSPSQIWSLRWPVPRRPAIAEVASAR